MNVEIGEEAEKHDGIKAHDVGNYLGEIALDEEQLRRVDENSYKLNHLHGSQMLLPPKIFLILWSHGSQQVVGIHNNVDESVEDAKESRVSTRSELDTPPNSCRHDTVVNDMQICDLVKFFPHDEEELKRSHGNLPSDKE